MGQLHRVVIAFCVALQLAACAGTSVIESQSRQRDPRLARLYFLRQSGFMGAAIPAAEVKVDGATVGSVTSGSYFFVDRPPGLHKLSVQSGLSLAFETEAQVEAGREYYFSVGVPKTGMPVQDLANQAYAGSSGQQMRGSFTGFSGAVLYSLAPSAGAAEIARLKPP